MQLQVIACCADFVHFTLCSLRYESQVSVNVLASFLKCLSREQGEYDPKASTGDSFINVLIPINTTMKFTFFSACRKTNREEE